MKKNFSILFFAIMFIAFANTMNAQTVVKSAVATLYKNLGTYLKTTDAQNAKAIPILTDYDTNIDAIKAKNVGNAQKIQQETNTLNTKTIESLKKVLNGEQILKLLVAISTSDNIVNGKNIDANQKAFLTKVKTQYKLNDDQLTAVALVMVQGKLRGDAIAQLSKTNQQLAGQEYMKLLQDLDSQLKASLSDEQYKNVKADIEKLVKGQKI